MSLRALALEIVLFAKIKQTKRIPGRTLALAGESAAIAISP